MTLSENYNMCVNVRSADFSRLSFGQVKKYTAHLVVFIVIFIVIFIAAFIAIFIAIFIAVYCHLYKGLKRGPWSKRLVSAVNLVGKRTGWYSSADTLKMRHNAEKLKFEI